MEPLRHLPSRSRPPRRSIRAAAAAAAAILAAAAAGPLLADATNEVDVAALAAIGTGMSTSGWILNAVTSSTAYSPAPAIRLGSKAAYVQSPRFAAPILRIEADIRSSFSAYRRLKFTPLGSTSAPAYLAEYSPEGVQFATQTLEWSAEDDVRAFVISLEGERSTAWAISRMVVVTADAAEGTAQGEGQSGQGGDPSPSGGTSGGVAQGTVSLAACAEGRRVRYALDIGSILETFASADETTLYISEVPALAGWHAFAGSQEADSIGSSSGAARVGGFYFWDCAAAPGIGTRSASQTTWRWGCILANDTPRPVRILRLTVGAGQWGASNTRTEPLTLEVAAAPAASANLMVAYDWRELGNPFFTATLTSETGQPALPLAAEATVFDLDMRLAPGEAMLVRFRDDSPSKGGNAAMGIWRFEVDGIAAGEGFSVHLQ